jgi:hypothetical protein
MRCRTSKTGHRLLGRVAARTHPMDNQKFWLLILFMLVITLALVASLYDLSPILH